MELTHTRSWFAAFEFGCSLCPSGEEPVSSGPLPGDAVCFRPEHSRAYWLAEKKWRHCPNVDAETSHIFFPLVPVVQNPQDHVYLAGLCFHDALFYSFTLAFSKWHNERADTCGYGEVKWGWGVWGGLCRLLLGSLLLSSQRLSFYLQSNLRGACDVFQWLWFRVCSSHFIIPLFFFFEDDEEDSSQTETEGSRHEIAANHRSFDRLSLRF